MRETEKMEFKSILQDDIYKGVVAFANTDGGTIRIGIDNMGEMAPLSDVDDSYTRVTNGIRDAIAPDVTIFVKYALEEGQVIRIEVGEGSYKPYYLKAKGLKPSGVYIRQGASSVQASPEQIRQMIKNADGDVFEELRSMEQGLSFGECARAFAKAGVEFGEDKYAALGIRSHTQQLYSNLGLLLSDQCMHTVKVAVFADERNTVFRDRKEFAGSVLRQAEETFDYLQLNNKNRSDIDGLARKDFWDYPKGAVREALLNALLHRDYGFSGSVIINVNDSCMDFISIGGLLPGISEADIRNGISQLRNRKLAEVFHRLQYIEAYGTGIRRIFQLYGDCPIPPSITVTPNSFRMTLPNINTAKGPQPRPQVDVTPQMQKVLDYLAAHKEATDEALQEMLGIKRTRLYNLLKLMCGASLVKTTGRGKNRKTLLYM